MRPLAFAGVVVAAVLSLPLAVLVGFVTVVATLLTAMLGREEAPST